jgi:hypothetical protein
MTGYAGKRPKWRQQEREAEASGQSYPLQGIDERTRDLFYGREPKKVKEGMPKYNNPKIEEAEKSLLMIKAAKEHGEFVPHRGHNELTEALGNPEHRDRVWGVSSRQSWKNVESWQSDTASYHTRKSYKEGIFQAGKEAAVKEMIIGSIKDAFTSTDPQMVELRTQMFRQASVMTQQGEASIQEPTVPGTSQPQRYPTNEIVEPSPTWLQVPWGRTGRKKNMATGTVQLPNPKARFHGRAIPPNYALVEVAWTDNHHDEDELDFANEEGDMTLG